jgi:hypothetical protein
VWVSQVSRQAERHRVTEAGLLRMDLSDAGCFSLAVAGSGSSAYRLCAIEWLLLEVKDGL